ncbi:MAG TPA: hypothetical protein VM009_01070, partial [Terriglobales bacterium]|nr:hypothetical protein [Terriglobales bacterium]
LEKIRKLAAIRSAIGNNFKIEIDGGVDQKTITEIVRAGADVLVAGNAIFGSGDPRLNTERLLKAAQEATMARA